MVSIMVLARPINLQSVVTFVALRLVILLLAVTAISGCETISPPQVHSVIVNDRLVSEATNDVTITRAGVAGPAAPGAGLQPGDVVITGPGSQAVLLLENGAVEVIILENSEVRISSIWVEIGEVFVRVKKKLREVFEVESEYGVAGVEGTEFVVRVRPKQQAREVFQCVTLQGQVSIRSPTGAWSPVSARAAEEVTVRVGASPQQRTLDQREFNALVKRVNDVERIYRPGSMQLLVPNVTGLNQNDARRVLAEQGVKVGKVTGRVTDKATIGEVLRQTPVAGQRIKSSNSVALEVEAEPTTVPQLVGRQLNDAVRNLTSKRLNQGDVTMEYTGNRPQGEVSRQQPKSGSRVAVNSAVDLWAEGDTIRVPSVVGSNVAAGRKLLKANGLDVGSQTERLVAGGKDGTILEQSIAARKPVARGTRVNLVVSMRGIKVPNLMNNTSSGASRVLASAGLKLGSTSTQTAQATPDRVFKQSPRAGTLLRPGDTVSITIARGCVVPNVRRLGKSAATSAIKAAGFASSIGSVGKYNPDIVFGQSPAAGKALKCGSRVTISLGTNIG